MATLYAGTKDIHLGQTTGARKPRPLVVRPMPALSMLSARISNLKRRVSQPTYLADERLERLAFK